MDTIPDGYRGSATEAFAVLAQRDRLTIDDLKVMALIEQSGKALYLALARVAGNAQASALLEKNAHEELGHAHRCLNAIRLLGGSFSLPPLEQNPYCEPPPSFDRLDPDFLRQLIEGEAGGDALYHKWASNEPNPAIAHLYRLNGKEETGHGNRVSQVIALTQ